MEEKYKKSLKWSILNLVLFATFLIIMELIIQSSVILCRIGLIIAIVLILIPAVVGYFKEVSYIDAGSTICLIIDLIYMFIFRNQVIRITFLSDKLDSYEKIKLMKLFEIRSGVFLIYNESSRKIISDLKREPAVRKFVNTYANQFQSMRLLRKLKYEPFGNASGYVDRIGIIMPLKPSQQDIQKHRLYVFGNSNSFMNTTF
ncbi:hypothetical protein NUSPORA_01355 [Nucleospora cyclopteri]